MILKRFVLITLFVILSGCACEAQQNPLQGHGAPSGVCTVPYTDTDTGNFWTCKLGLFVQAGGGISSAVGPVINATSPSSFGGTVGASSSLMDNATVFSAISTFANTAAYASVGTPTIRSTVSTPMTGSTVSSATATVNISAGDTVLVGTITFNAAQVVTITVSDGTNTYYPVNLNSSPLNTTNEQVQIFGTPPGLAKACSSCTLTVSVSPSSQMGFIVLDTFNVGSYGQTNLQNTATSATPTASVTTQDANNILATWGQLCGGGITVSANTGTLQQFWNNNCEGFLVTNTAASAATTLTTTAQLSAGTQWATNGIELRSVTTLAPTVYFPCSPVAQTTCRYYYTSGLNFTRPVTLKGEPGATLCYMGTAHAIDMGNTSNPIFQINPYTIDGLRFECGAGMTEGIFFQAHMSYNEVKNSVFYNFGNTTACTVFGNGDNEDFSIFKNKFIVFDNSTLNNIAVPTPVPSRCFVDLTTAATFSTLLFNENTAQCAAVGAVGCGTGSGPLLKVDSYFNTISNNNISGGFCPFVRLAGSTSAYGTLIEGNNVEVDQNGCYAITFVQPQTDGLKVIGNKFNNKSSTPTSFVGPADGTRTLTNSEVSNNYLANQPLGTPVVALNNLAGQTGNIGWHNTCSTGGGSGTTPCALLHTLGANISQWNADRYPKLTFAAGTTASYTFGVTYGVAPVCTIPPNITGTATTLTITTLNTTTLTITASASNSATVFAVCSEDDAQ